MEPVRAAIVVFSIAFTGCLSLNQTVCENGLVCGPGTICIDNECAPVTCGDGILHPGEDCDGSAFALTCFDEGYYSGEPTCLPTCRITTSGCSGACGDGLVNGPEQCDGTAPGLDCMSQGFDYGSLGCTNCVSNYAECGLLRWEVEFVGDPIILTSIVRSGSDQLVVGAVGFPPRRKVGDFDWRADADGPSTYEIVNGTGDELWAASPDGVFHYDGATWLATDITEDTRHIVWLPGDDVFALSHNDEWPGSAKLWHFDGTTWTLEVERSSIGAVQLAGLAATASDRVFLAFDNGPSDSLHSWDGNDLDLELGGQGFGFHISDVAIVDGDPIIATSRGVEHRRNGEWIELGVSARRLAADGELGAILGGDFGIAHLYRHGTTVTFLPGVGETLNAVNAYSSPGEYLAAAQDGTLITSRGSLWGTVPLQPVGWDWGDPHIEIGAGPGTLIGFTGATSYRRTLGDWTLIPNGTGFAPDALYAVASEDVLAARYDASLAALPANSDAWQNIDLPAEIAEGPFVVDGPSMDLFYLAYRPETGSNETQLWFYDAGAGAPWTLLRAQDMGPLGSLVWSPSGSYYLAVDGDVRTLNPTAVGAPVKVAETLLAAAAVGDNAIVAVGQRGAATLLQDGSWVPIPVPTNEDLLAASGSQANDIFATGRSGTLFYFDGVEWTRIRSQPGRLFTHLQAYEDRVCLFYQGGIDVLLRRE